MLPKINSISITHSRHDEPKMIVTTSNFVDPGTSYEVDVNDYSLKVVKKSEIAD